MQERRYLFAQVLDSMSLEIFLHSADSLVEAEALIHNCSPGSILEPRLKGFN
jgi:hypothetical protein